MTLEGCPVPGDTRGARGAVYASHWMRTSCTVCAGEDDARSPTIRNAAKGITHHIGNLQFESMTAPSRSLLGHRGTRRTAGARCLAWNACNGRAVALLGWTPRTMMAPAHACSLPGTHATSPRPR